MYEARHELLKLTTPLLKPVIPATYFAPCDYNMELGYRKNLAMMLANYPESPMTPSMQLGPYQYNSPFAPITSKYNQYTSPSVPRLQQHNERFRLNPQLQFQQHPFQQQQLPQQQQPTHQFQHANMNFLSPYQNTNLTHSISNPNLTPHINHNSSGNTSGYHSYSSSTTSLEQLFPPFQGQGSSAAASALVAAAAAASASGYGQQQMTGHLHNTSTNSDYSSNSSNDFKMDGGGLRRLSGSTMMSGNDQQHHQQISEHEHNMQQNFDIPVILLCVYLYMNDLMFIFLEFRDFFRLTAKKSRATKPLHVLHRERFVHQTQLGRVLISARPLRSPWNRFPIRVWLDQVRLQTRIQC